MTEPETEAETWMAFQRRAQTVLSDKWGTALTKRKVEVVPGGPRPQEFDLVSPDGYSLVGDAKLFNPRHGRPQGGKQRNIADYVVLLRVVRPPGRRFLVFGGNVGFAKEWLASQKETSVEFWFLTARNYLMPLNQAAINGWPEFRAQSVPP